MIEACICGLVFETIEGYRQHLVNGVHMRTQKRQYETARQVRYGQGVSIDEWEAAK